MQSNISAAAVAPSQFGKNLIQIRADAFSATL